MSKFAFPCSLALLFAVAQPAMAVPNLVVNGSFELGPTPGSFITLPVGSRALPGWTVIRSDIDYIGSYWMSSDGARSVDLDSMAGAGGVTQTIRMIPGGRYWLWFDLAGNPTCAPAVKVLAVYIGDVAGSATTYRFDTSHATLSAMGWRHIRLPFVAPSAATTLTFLSLDPPGNNCGPALDNVAVTNTPSYPISYSPLVWSATYGETATVINFSGLWRATYPGGPLRVRVVQRGSYIVATLIDGNSYVSRGKVTLTGSVTGTSFPAQQICAFPGYTSPHWVSALVTVHDANHFSEDVNNCGATRVEWTRVR